MRYLLPCLFLRAFGTTGMRVRGGIRTASYNFIGGTDAAPRRLFGLAVAPYPFLLRAQVSQPGDHG